MEIIEIKKKLEAIKEIPTLPAIAMEINSLLQAPDTTIEMIENCIEKDQAISIKVLKLINSAFFGLRSKVISIHDAIVLLGFNSIRNIVLSVSVIKTFSKSNTGEIFSITDFWKHSIAVAMTSKYLSEQTKSYSPEDSFTGGLLHDIGKIIMAQYFTDIFISTVNDIKNESLSFSMAEKKYLKTMGHAKMSAFLTKKWNFPNSLTMAIKNHHSIVDNLSELESIIHIADGIVNFQAINSSSLSLENKKSKLPVINKKVDNSLKKYFASSMEWYPDVAESIMEACSFFIEDTE